MWTRGESLFRILLLLLLAAALDACTHVNQPERGAISSAGIDGTVWMTTTEYRGNATAIYRSAALQLDHIVSLNDSADLVQRHALPDTWRLLPPAVVMDLDETALDNGGYAAFQIQTHQGFSNHTWQNWVEQHNAEAVPGAVAFTKAAEAAGVRVFYISDRSCDRYDEHDNVVTLSGAPCEQLAATMRTLAVLGFAFADDPAAFLLAPAGAVGLQRGKSVRRASIAQRYRIVMLFGDNARDFIDDRQAACGKDKDEINALLGYSWFLLANPSYGASWQDGAAAVGHSLRTTKNTCGNSQCLYWEKREEMTAYLLSRDTSVPHSSALKCY